MQIRLRDGEPFGERAVVVQNSNHRPLRTMIAESDAAIIALAAVAVDFTDNPFPRERTGQRFAYEFVSENSRKPHVAFDELQIGLADAREDRPHEDFVCVQCRFGKVVANRQFRLIQIDRFHAPKAPAGLSVSNGRLRAVRRSVVLDRSDTADVLSGR
jgi:hypothetical protein